MTSNFLKRTDPLFVCRTWCDTDTHSGERNMEVSNSETSVPQLQVPTCTYSQVPRTWKSSGALEVSIMSHPLSFQDKYPLCDLHHRRTQRYYRQYMIDTVHCYRERGLERRTSYNQPVINEHLPGSPSRRFWAMARLSPPLAQSNSNVVTSVRDIDLTTENISRFDTGESQQSVLESVKTESFSSRSDGTVSTNNPEQFTGPSLSRQAPPAYEAQICIHDGLVGHPDSLYSNLFAQAPAPSHTEGMTGFHARLRSCNENCNYREIPLSLGASLDPDSYNLNSYPELLGDPSLFQYASAIGHSPFSEGSDSWLNGSSHSDIHLQHRLAQIESSATQPAWIVAQDRTASYLYDSSIPWYDVQHLSNPVTSCIYHALSNRHMHQDAQNLENGLLCQSFQPSCTKDFQTLPRSGQTDASSAKVIDPQVFRKEVGAQSAIRIDHADLLTAQFRSRPATRESCEQF